MDLTMTLYFLIFIFLNSSLTFPPNPCLRQDIPTINNTITARHITTRITRQIQKQALNLFYIALPAQRNHPQSLIDNLGPSPHLGIEKPGAHNVNPRKLAPFASE